MTSLETETSEAPTGLRQLATIKVRADFLRAASGRKQSMPAFLLQARRRADGSEAARVGFTCSRKVGNAVVRNRAKRRLREIARTVLGTEGQAGWDYVLVGRPGATVERPFHDMIDDLRAALLRIHAERGPR